MNIDQLIQNLLNIKKEYKQNYDNQIESINDTIKKLKEEKYGVLYERIIKEFNYRFLHYMAVYVKSSNCNYLIRYYIKNEKLNHQLTIYDGPKESSGILLKAFYKDGKLDGNVYIKYKYNHYTILSKFKHGIFNGTVKHFYKNKNLHTEIEYINSIAINEKLYKINGELKSITIFKNSIPYYKENYYNNEKHCYNVDRYELIHGEYICYDLNNNILQKSNYNHGTLNGYQFIYYNKCDKNSFEHLHIMRRYLNNNYYRETIISYEGNIIETCDYINNDKIYKTLFRRHGLCKFYNENEELINIVNYNNGKKINLPINYYESIFDGIKFKDDIVENKEIKIQYD